MSKVVLPEEMKGKSPEEVAAYYQSLLETQKTTYEAAISAFDTKPDKKPDDPPEKPPEKKITMNDMLTDPTKHVGDMIRAQGVSREEWNQATAALRDSFTYVAKERAMKEIEAEVGKNKGLSQWTRLSDQIDRVIAAFEPMARTSPETWKSVYYYVVGQNQPTLEREAVTHATMPAEVPNAGGNTPPEPIKLSREQKIVAEGFGLTEDTFRKGIEDMRETKLPLTMDNRRKR